MTNSESQGVESVLLADGSGGYFAVPTSVIESYRLTDEAAAALQSGADSAEVSGYAHPALKRLGEAVEGASQTWVAMASYYVPEMALQQKYSKRSGRSTRASV